MATSGKTRKPIKAARNRVQSSATGRVAKPVKAQPKPEPLESASDKASLEASAFDHHDSLILQALQSDGRLSNAELAARIGLSPAPTWRRVKALEAQGVITGYRAEIDRRKIGLGVLAFVRIDAERNTAEATQALEAALRQIPQVIACHYISGAGTFELQVMTTNLDAFSHLAIEVLLKLPHVKDLHTSFSLGEVKASGLLPLVHLSRR